MLVPAPGIEPDGRVSGQAVANRARLPASVTQGPNVEQEQQVRWMSRRGAS